MYQGDTFPLFPWCAHLIHDLLIKGESICQDDCLNKKGQDKKNDETMRHKEADRLDVMLSLLFRYIHSVCYHDSKSICCIDTSTVFVTMTVSQSAV